MGRTPKISARVLASCSLVLWTVSLGLTAFTTDGVSNRWPGYEILALGWLGPFDGNVAWFANPLLLWAAVTILRGRSAATSTLAAVVCALSMILVSEVSIDEDGHTAPIEVYGWGAIFWLVSVCIMAVACGTRELEQTAGLSNVVGWRQRLRPWGLVLSAGVVAATAAACLYDRSVGNAAERTSLAGLAFKRVPVCSVPDPMPIQAMKPLSGPLEVVLSVRSSTLSGKPFNGPVELLGWGIPVVRFGGRDYSYAFPTDGSMIASRVATTPAGALLQVSDLLVGGGEIIQATLTDSASAHVVLRQTWAALLPGGTICPGYTSAPRSTDQPRKVLLQTLQLPPTTLDQRNAEDEFAAAHRPMSMVVVSRGGAGTQSGRVISGSSDQKTTPCPADLGRVGRDADGVAFRLQLSPPFRVGQVFFYRGDPTLENVYCGGDGHTVYFYRSWAYPGAGTVSIEARTLPDFRLAWAGDIRLDEVEPETQPRAIKIQTLEQSGPDLTIRFVNEQSGRWVVAKLSPPDSGVRPQRD